MENKFDNVAKQAIERYSNRLLKYGNDIKTLGWGSVYQQEYRFLNILKSLSFEDKTIVDIGCGFGDLFNTLINNKCNIKSYKGWDLNDKLISQATNRNDVRVTYDQVDISKDSQIYDSEFDIGVMLGLLNFNLNSEDLNYEYSELIIKNAFNVVKEVLVVDFLSSNISTEYPKEDFVFYHNPVKMLEFALKLTPNVVLKHDYSPIPQKEFMLYLYK